MKRRSKSFYARPMDARTAAEAFRDRGTPARQWISYGVVSAVDDDQPENVVTFETEEGAPLVSVLLEPSKIPVVCRVGSMAAGNGEGEWSPFVQGDEVLVAIPEADERAGCVILCRLNNAIDRFPFESVAGQDPTTNSFAFQRRRTPFLQEFAGPVFIRSALSEAFISIDQAGTLTLRDGEGSALQVSPDAMTLQSADASFLLQGDLTGQRITMQIGDSLLQMNASGADNNPGQTWLVAPSRFTCRTGADYPAEHVATVEFVLGCLGLFSKAITPVGGGEPSTGGAPLAAVLTAITAGQVPLDTTTGQLVVAALNAGLPIAGATPKPPPVGGLQLLPGLGALNFVVG